MINHSGKAKSVPVGLTMGALTGLGITLILSVAAAKMVDTGTVKETGIGYIAMGILMVSSFAAALTSVNSIKHRKMMVCGLSALIYYGILLSLTALFFGGQYQGMGVTGLVVLCGAALALMAVAGQGGGAAGKKRRKTAHR